MKRMLRLGAILIGIFSASPNLLAGPPDGWQFVDYEKGFLLHKKEKRPLFVLFGQDPCPYCDHLSKHVFADKKLKDVYEKEYVLVYVDVIGLNEQPQHVLPDGSSLSHRAFVRHHKAYATPSWSFYDRQGNLVLNGTGSKETPERFLKFHQYVKDSIFKKMSIQDFMSK